MNNQTINHVSVINASVSDFELIKGFIKQFELDNRELKNDEFLVAKQNNELLGFGRVRQHNNCSELCSLGVIETERLKGIGKRLVKELTNKSPNNLYLVCIIPDFFKPLGFTVVNQYPQAMQQKLDYCTSELVVPETYVVMKYNASNT